MGKPTLGRTPQPVISPGPFRLITSAKPDGQVPLRQGNRTALTSVLLAAWLFLGPQRPGAAIFQAKVTSSIVFRMPRLETKEVVNGPSPTRRLYYTAYRVMTPGPSTRHLRSLGS